MTVAAAPAAPRPEPPPLRLAIVQQAMYWTTAENTARIVASLALAAARGAQVAVCPELALTGFHRGIRAQGVPEIVAPALQAVRTACAELAIACALGAPTFAGDGTVLNSYLFIDAEGEIASVVSKNGLTPAELTFFAAGADRPVMRFAGRRCSTVMCREVEDLDAIAAQLQPTPVDLVFWPALVGHPPGTVFEPPHDSSDLGYVEAARRMALRLQAHVVQSNWPHALNTPESTHKGESKVYAPDGEILLTLPRDESGVAVLNLGARRFVWTPMPA